MIVDLPNLQTISFKRGPLQRLALQGDNRDNRKTIIKGHDSYDNTLIIKSNLKSNEMKYEICCNDECLDLPSLTEIQSDELSLGCFLFIGHVILESIMFCNHSENDVIRYSKT